LNEGQTRTAARFLNDLTRDMDDQDLLTIGGFVANHDVILFNSECRELRG
jgi:hypothetical protein